MGLGDAHAQRGEDILPWHAQLFDSSEHGRAQKTPLPSETALSPNGPSSLPPFLALLSFSSVYYGLGQALWWVQETKD